MGIRLILVIAWGISLNMTSNRYEVYPAKVVNMDTSLNLELESANHNKYKHNM